MLCSAVVFAVSTLLLNRGGSLFQAKPFLSFGVIQIAGLELSSSLPEHTVEHLIQEELGSGATM